MKQFCLWMLTLLVLMRIGSLDCWIRCSWVQSNYTLLQHPLLRCLCRAHLETCMKWHAHWRWFWFLASGSVARRACQMLLSLLSQKICPVLLWFRCHVLYQAWWKKGVMPKFLSCFYYKSQFGRSNCVTKSDSMSMPPIQRHLDEAMEGITKKTWPSWQHSALKWQPTSSFGGGWALQRNVASPCRHCRLLMAPITCCQHHST